MSSFFFSGAADFGTIVAATQINLNSLFYAELFKFQFTELDISSSIV